MGVVGGPGMGKSMLFESMSEVFCVSGKPEDGSTFPFSGIIGADVLVWQEFTWSSKVCSFDNLLSVVVGEQIGIRIPSDKPVQYRNNAPFFYTALQPLCFRTMNYAEAQAKNAAVAERFKTRHWTIPLPGAERLPTFPKCGCCFARFVLHCQHHWQTNAWHAQQQLEALRAQLYAQAEYYEA